MLPEGRQARGRARVFACRSIEPEQSLGPLAKPACARMGSDGRDLCRNRCIEGTAGRSGTAEGGGFAVSRTGAGIDELVERLKNLSLRLVAIEATGGFETVVAAGLGRRRPAGGGGQSGAGAGVRAGAWQARQDRSDRRRVIAHFAEATKPELRQLPDATTRLLADLVARRRQIVEMIGGGRPTRRVILPHRA